MKRYTVIFALIIAAALSGACIERIIPSEEEMLPGINLRFSLGDFPETKAKIDSAGVTSLNENKLNSVEYFIYPDNGTGSDAVMHGYLSNVVANTRVYSVPVTDDIVNTVLCPGSSRYFKIYAIANHPRIIPEAATENLSHTSVAELEALTRDLDTDSQTGNILSTQNSFLMSTNGAFRVGPVEKRATNVVSARIPLERVAAKITILVRLEESVTISNTVVINGVSDVRNEVWIPRPSQMQVYLVNTAITGQVSGQPVASSPLMQYPTMEFSRTSTETHSYSTFTPVLDGNGDVTDYTEVTHEGQFTPCEAPFYTNPISWEYGSETEPYIKLMIPWDRQPGVSTGGISYGSASKNYYYRIYCPGDAIDGSHAQFVRNNWYKIVLNVGVLGSDTDGGESIINGKYYVVDWQERDTASGGSGTESGVNDSDKEAEIKGARYLFVNKNEYPASFLFDVTTLIFPVRDKDNGDRIKSCLFEPVLFPFFCGFVYVSREDGHVEASPLQDLYGFDEVFLHLTRLVKLLCFQFVRQRFCPSCNAAVHINVDMDTRELEFVVNESLCGEVNPRPDKPKGQELRDPGPCQHDEACFRDQQRQDQLSDHLRFPFCFKYF